MTDMINYAQEERIKPIDHIDFGILSPEELHGISAFGKDSIGIENPDLYDNLEPKKGGLIDARMGPYDTHTDCATCGLNLG